MCERVWESVREAAKPTQLQTRKPDLEPTNVTRPYLPILATVSTALGTNLKLRSRPPFPCHPHRRKPTGTLAIEAWKPATFPLCSVEIFAGFGWHHQLDFVPHDSLFHFRPSIAIGSHCFASCQLLEFTAIEVDSGVVTARWSSPLVPLNSAWLEHLDLSFPASID